MIILSHCVPIIAEGMSTTALTKRNVDLPAVVRTVTDCMKRSGPHTITK